MLAGRRRNAESLAVLLVDRGAFKLGLDVVCCELVDAPRSLALLECPFIERPRIAIVVPTSDPKA
jgi:hypothetical protein